MKIIQLTQNKVAIVDDEDYEELNKFNWTYIKSTYTYYASRNDYKNNKVVGMHRVVMNCPKGMEIDHINGDGFDNRKSNLRICTRSQNNYNNRIRKNNTSGIKGVWWNKRNKKWCVGIRIRYKNKHLGSFSDINDAKLAYEKAAKLYFGEFYSDGIKILNKDLIEKINNMKVIKKERLRINNTSGIQGVSWDKSRNRWLSQIIVDKKNKYLGRYSCIADAKAAYDVAAGNILND